MEYTINYLRAIELFPAELGVHFAQSEDKEPDEGLLEIARHLGGGEENRFVKNAIEARDPDDSPHVQELREKVLQEFAETVFCGKISGDPPIRGPSGKQKSSSGRVQYQCGTDRSKSQGKEGLRGSS